MTEGSSAGVGRVAARPGRTIAGSDAVQWLLDRAENRSPVGEASRTDAHVDAGYGDIIAAARLGTSGPGAPLPHLDRIQRSFGRHDVSGVVAHVDEAAASAGHAMGAAGFTMGNHTAFVGAPSLRTAAHEAAHAVQQRGDLQLPDRMGRTGDVHERHADDVAARVEAGQSSEDLLDRYAPRAESAATAGVQRTCAACTGEQPCSRCASSDASPPRTSELVQREPDPAAEEAADVERERQQLIGQKAQEIEEIETTTGAYLDLDAAKVPAERTHATRELAVLMHGNPRTYDELVALENQATLAGRNEQAAIAGVVPAGSPADLSATWSNAWSWAFPELWADRLNSAMKPPIDPAQAQRRRELAWRDLVDAGKLVPPFLVEHGLPVDFDRAYELERFTASPQLAGLPDTSPLHAVGTAMTAYQGAYADEQLAIRYTAAIANLVSRVRGGEERIDAVVFPQYAFDRRWPPSPADLFRDFPTNPLAGDRVNPYAFDRDTFKVLALLSILDRFTAGRQVQSEYERVQAQADELLRARSGWNRLSLAHRWANERGYPEFVRDVIWSGIKRDFPQIAKDALVDTGEFIAIQWIPIVDVLYDAYVLGKGVYHVIDAAWSLAEAEHAAAEATTIVGLQRAAARLVLAEHTEALKLVAGALEAFGGWSALRNAMKPAAGAAAEQAAEQAGKRATGAARSASSVTKRVAAGTARGVKLPGGDHVLTVVEQLGRMFVRMCSPSCGAIINKLQRLLSHLEKAGADTAARDAVTVVLDSAIALDARLPTLTQSEAEAEMAKLVAAVERLGETHPSIADALPEIESLEPGDVPTGGTAAGQDPPLAGAAAAPRPRIDRLARLRGELAERARSARRGDLAARVEAHRSDIEGLQEMSDAELDSFKDEIGQLEKEMDELTRAIDDAAAKVPAPEPPKPAAPTLDPEVDSARKFLQGKGAGTLQHVELPAGCGVSIDTLLDKSPAELDRLLEMADEDLRGALTLGADIDVSKTRRAIRTVIKLVDESGRLMQKVGKS